MHAPILVAFKSKYNDFFEPLDICSVSQLILIDRAVIVTIVQFVTTTITNKLFYVYICVVYKKSHLIVRTV